MSDLVIKARQRRVAALRTQKALVENVFLDTSARANRRAESAPRRLAA